jgi:hypothetical protein
MVNRAVMGLLLFAMLIGTVSAAPFSVKTSVNGVDPSKETAVVKAGGTAQISVDVNTNANDVMIDSVEFESSPSAMAGILEAFMEKRTQFPKALEPIHDTNAYEIPGLLPAGDYEITALIHYSGPQSGTAKYTANVKVENEGLLSMILGLLAKILPKFIVKPITGAVI